MKKMLIFYLLCTIYKLFFVQLYKSSKNSVFILTTRIVCDMIRSQRTVQPINEREKENEKKYLLRKIL